MIDTLTDPEGKVKQQVIGASDSVHASILV